MYRYCIADILIDIIEDTFKDKPYIKERMDFFSSNHIGDADMTIRFMMSNMINFPDGKVLIDEKTNLYWVEKTGGNGFYGYKSRLSRDEIVDILDVDTNWSNGIITLLDANYYDDVPINPIDAIGLSLIGTMFRNRILLQDGIVIHASSIIHEGKGIAFTAPSGTGKSTHVRLWENYNNARVINDDTPPVRIVNGKAFIYGSPWSGSSDKFLNEKAPLEAIFVLEQAPENSVKMLSKHETIARMLPRMFLPYFNNNLMELAFTNFENLIDKVPVYLLKCRPDIEAMETAYACVK